MLRLDQILVEKGLVSTRTRAGELIQNGKVQVNGKLVEKCGKKFDPESDIQLLEEESPWVSRGSIKLLAAFEKWNIDVAGKIGLDIGASTGGFTQVLLSKNIAKVYAVDTGVNQLAPAVNMDSRVINLEKSNFRYFHGKSLPEVPEVAVIDVSFISQVLLYPALKACLSKGGDVISLVKPQFEAGKERVGKGGIIRDLETRKLVLDEVMAEAKLAGFTIHGVMDSPIEGGDGNKEFLMYMSL